MSRSVDVLFLFFILFLSDTKTAAGNSICRTYEDPYIVTFDKLKHRFQEVSCKYLFVKDCSENNEFTVMTTNRECEHGSCLSYVTVRFDKYEIALSTNAVTVNKINITHFPYVPSANLTIEKLGDLGEILIETNIGLTVKPHLQKRKLQVELSTKYKNKTCGFCGNYNGNKSDDYIVEKEGCLPPKPKIPDPCKSSPCKNGGACKQENVSFVCTCVGDFQGETCEDVKCTGAKLDIVYVVDTSGSISSEDFIKLKNVMKNLNSRFKIAPGMTHAGLINYSMKVEVVFGLKEGQDMQKTNQEIENMEHQSSLTFTGSALKKCRTEVLSMANGNRADIPDVVFLLTDGIATGRIEKSLQLEEAKSLNNDGVTIFTIAIGLLVGDVVDEMASASKLTGKKLVYRTDFSTLESFVNDLIQETCAV